MSTPPAKSLAPNPRERSILMISSGLGRGGSELQLCQLAIGLHQRGWPIEVVSLQIGGVYREWLEEEGLRVFEVAVGRFGGPAALAHLERLIRQVDPLVVHTQAFRANLWGRTLAIARRLPVVASLRVTYSYYPHVYYPVERALAYATARLVVPSVAAARHLSSVVKVPPAKIAVIPNGVNTNDFAPIEGDRGVVRRRWLIDEEFVVLAPGRLVPHKDQAAIIDAFYAVKAAKPSCVLMVVGSGPLERQLRAQAAALGTGVRFTGELNRKQMAEVMSLADVICLMSHVEGTPNVILEAMASGVAVIGSAAAGTAELIVDGRNGWIVPVGNAQALAQRLVQLASAPELGKMMGRAGRQKVCSDHSLDANVSRHEALYETAIRSRR